MYFLSLMAGTQPAAEDDAAWKMAVSNLIEVTQTRSVYGQVMNKRSAAGAKSSDTNDRTEPLVGSAVVLAIYKDSLGTKRCENMPILGRFAMNNSLAKTGSGQTHGKFNKTAFFPAERLR